MGQVNRSSISPDLHLSGVLTGLWQIADIERKTGTLDPVAAARAMVPYVEAGFTTFDMADHYGSAEVIAGHFRNNYPDLPAQFFTKWVPPPGVLTRAEVQAAVHKALRRLQTDSVELLQYHAWNYADPVWLDQLFWLQELKQEGLIRHLGVTNFDAAHLDLVLHSGIEIATNQVSFSLLDRRARNALAAVCEQHHVKLLAYGTLGGGFLTDRWLGKPSPEAPDTWYLMKYRRFIEASGGWEAFQHLLTSLHQVAHNHGMSVANVASRFILDEPFVAGIIIGARLGERSHLTDNQNLFSFELDRSDKQLIEEALAGLQPIPGDCGDEYRRPPFLTASGDLSHHLDTMPAPYSVSTNDRGESRVYTGTPWEPLAGFARAVRSGNRILVSGTTATHRDRLIGGSDPAAQTHFILDKIEGVLQSMGAALKDVKRTRIYIRNAEDWEAVSRAHGTRFKEIHPANTLVQAAIIGEEYLVEIEAEAEVVG